LFQEAASPLDRSPAKNNSITSSVIAVSAFSPSLTGESGTPERRERDEPPLTRLVVLRRGLAAPLEVAIDELRERQQGRQVTSACNLYFRATMERARPDRRAPVLGQRLSVALRGNVLARLGVDGEPKTRSALWFEIEIPTVRTFRLGAPRAAADFADAAIRMTSLHGCVLSVGRRIGLAACERMAGRSPAVCAVDGSLVPVVLTHGRHSDNARTPRALSPRTSPLVCVSTH